LDVLFDLQSLVSNERAPQPLEDNIGW
jgi:hypothetical protein